jgi:hypothetical protein
MTNSKFRIPACSVAHSALRGKYLPLPLLGNEEGILISFLITESPCENRVACPHTKTYQLSEEAILGITSNVQLPPYIKIASHYGARDVSDEVGSIFAGCPFLLVRFLFGKEKKMNAEILSACRR